MRSLIVSAIFPPEPVVSARTSFELAEELTTRGHQVGVLAPFPSRPGGHRYPGYPARIFWRECFPKGYGVTRCFALASTESKLSSRLLENLTFGLSAAWQVFWTRPKPDVIYANTWPLVAQGLLGIVAVLRQIPIILSIQDLYPESLAAQGRIQKNSRLYHWLVWLDGWVARSVAALVVISANFAHVYQEDRKVETKKVWIIPNWVDENVLLLELSLTGNAGVELRQRLHIPAEAFLLIYAGNIGAAAGLEAVIQELAKFESIHSVHLLIAGEGTQLEVCRSLVHQLKLQNVHFLSPWPKKETAAVFSSADLFLLPTHGDQAFASLPSKLVSYMLAARPILVIAPSTSDLASAITEADCGWAVPPGDAPAFETALQQAIRSPSNELARLGGNGRAYALEHFSRSANLPRLVEIIENVGLKTSPTGPAIPQSKIKNPKS